MTDIEISGIILGLSVSKVLMRETPHVFKAIESKAYDFIFKVFEERSLSMTECSKLLEVSLEEAEAIMTQARLRANR